ncbi:MAG: peptide deformylase [Fusobacteria bacterium]|nr:peptide deformylase [Fusobacteriota bacterium]
MQTILKYGSGLLRKKAIKYAKEELNSTLHSFIQEMYNTLEEYEGIGLAAPQVGVSKRLFVIEYSGIKAVYINPEILEKSSDIVEYEEGCLSVPGIYESVKRPESIKIQYLDEKFIQHTEVLNEVHARIFQHEFDHLEGLLFVDKLSSLRKNLLKKKLKKIEKNEIEK